ncbi:TetR/AcrR family transcriptional regulator [Nocardioides donggukensis]|uniref:TetR family transcriptional regulator n=1 Tax=Nocardioides donggukensis TaxID=2774019 RepID=A0A927K480_9ACTN|nr:TetR/AcrR family transcriptional regulator [Nocardioides donggukensis]MBD8869899.1 TetR family transcriptional regulator [Nocardioides donggukensis]
MGYLKAADREQQIVEAAIRVLSDVGVPGTTLRAVAAEAGIPLGTLHYAFPSKDKLLRAVIGVVTDEIATTLRQGLVLDRGVEHALRHGVLNFWNTLVESEIGLQIMQYELTTYALRSEGPGGLASLQYERYTSLVTEFCEQAAKAAEERCAIGFDSLGRVTLALIDGLILQYVVRPDHDRALRDLNHALDMVIALADPRPVASERRRA